MSMTVLAGDRHCEDTVGDGVGDGGWLGGVGWRGCFMEQVGHYSKPAVIEAGIYLLSPGLPDSRTPTQ